LTVHFLAGYVDLRVNTVQKGIDWDGKVLTEDTMRRILVISESVREKFPVADDNEFPVVYTDNTPEQLVREMDATDPKPLFSIIAIPFHEYETIDRQLNIITYSDIYYQLVIFGDDRDMENEILHRLYHVSEFRNSPMSEKEVSFVIRKSFAVLDEYYENETMKMRFMTRLMDTHQDQEDLIDIGKALSIEKDFDKLLRLILFQSKKITGADAGSIYLVEEDEKGEKRLRFKYSHTFSRDIPLEEFVLEINKKSVAGYVAATGEVLNIPDAYHISPMAPYSFNTYIDKRYNYRSQSMLVVPMRNHEDEIIGVIQLLNSKEDLNGRKVNEPGNEAYSLRLETPEDFEQFVVTFDKKYDSLMEAIASQAAIALENNRLLKQIENQFQEFVKASVTAIESRDPATSGHSFRVAEICIAMARAINEVEEGYLAQFSFSENEMKELEFAALLHDFGKVYVDPNIFKKAKKLFPGDYANLQLRLDYLYRYVELLYAKREGELRIRFRGNELDLFMEELKKEREQRLARIRDIKERIEKLNEPALTTEDPEEVLADILAEVESLHCMDLDNNKVSVFNDKDRINLVIPRGSLNPGEREEIESHVVHTYNFVSKIPWPPEYAHIPEIALRHHEKLDGTGYPDHLKGRESTTIQSRIMAMADVYDALAAKDRPYKKAVPLDRVLSILEEEAEKGKLDPDLVRLFIDKKIYEQIDMTKGVVEEPAATQTG
jgi:HD-GYP domain-containing protein (c-di-GMP phosphodiesterase class II)